MISANASRHGASAPALSANCWRAASEAREPLATALAESSAALASDDQTDLARALDALAAAAQELADGLRAEQGG